MRHMSYGVKIASFFHLSNVFLKIWQFFPERFMCAEVYLLLSGGGEEQLYFHCPDCRIYSDAYFRRD